MNLDTFKKELANLEAKLTDTTLSPREQGLTYKRVGQLKEIFELEAQIQKMEDHLSQIREMIQSSDPEVAELARGELAGDESLYRQYQARLEELTLPHDPTDDREAIIEIRAGAGGDEAALFAGDLFRMYLRFADAQGWKTEMLNTSESEGDGYKEVSFEVHGDGAYGQLKFESGVHRVQRVPATEAKGRVHTSTATVAVLPVVEDVEVELRAEDLRIDVFRSGGHGGQSVNTTDSAVRITHLPTGIVATCQDEKSQTKNKEKAMGVLRSRLFEFEQAKQHEEIAGMRKSQIGSGDRSEKIRTYNFPQDRITDHRVKESWHNLDGILAGNLEPIITTLKKAERDGTLGSGDSED